MFKRVQCQTSDRFDQLRRRLAVAHHLPDVPGFIEGQEFTRLTRLPRSRYFSNLNVRLKTHIRRQRVL